MKRLQRHFKPTDENERRLAIAVKLGISPSDVVNKALEKCGKQIIEAKAKKLRQELAVQIP